MTKMYVGIRLVRILLRANDLHIDGKVFNPPPGGVLDAKLQVPQNEGVDETQKEIDVTLPKYGSVRPSIY